MHVDDHNRNAKPSHVPTSKMLDFSLKNVWNKDDPPRKMELPMCKMEKGKRQRRHYERTN